MELKQKQEEAPETSCRCSSSWESLSAQAVALRDGQNAELGEVLDQASATMLRGSQELQMCSSGVLSWLLHGHRVRIFAQGPQRGPVLP